MGFNKQLAPMAIKPERTFEIVLNLPALGAGPPTLIVRYAGDGNDAFINADAKARKTLGMGDETAQRARMDRELDAVVYAETVIVGWKNIFEDGATEPCPFSPAKCTEYLLALSRGGAVDQFNRIYLARMPSNFRDAIVSADDLGKG